MSDEMNEKRDKAAEVFATRWVIPNTLSQEELSALTHAYASGWDACRAEMEADNKRLWVAIEKLQCYCHLKNTGMYMCSCCKAKEAAGGALKEDK